MTQALYSGHSLGTRAGVRGCCVLSHLILTVTTTPFYSWEN